MYVSLCVTIHKGCHTPSPSPPTIHITPLHSTPLHPLLTIRRADHSLFKMPRQTPSLLIGIAHSAPPSLPLIHPPLLSLPPSVPFRNPSHTSCLGCLVSRNGKTVMALCHKHAFVTRHNNCNRHKARQTTQKVMSVYVRGIRGLRGR